MAIIKTQKHELEYDTETGQLIFNGGRNKTPLGIPVPARLVLTETSGSEIDGTKMVLGPSDNIDGTKLIMSSGTIEGHTLKL